MSLTIRLAKTGKKNSHSFKMVVSNTRSKRNGKYLEILGFFDPSTKPAKFSFDEAKLIEWKSKGALTSKAVDELVAGTYEFVKYNPKGDNVESAK